MGNGPIQKEQGKSGEEKERSEEGVGGGRWGERKKMIKKRRETRSRKIAKEKGREDEKEGERRGEEREGSRKKRKIRSRTKKTRGSSSSRVMEHVQGDYGALP